MFISCNKWSSLGRIIFTAYVIHERLNDPGHSILVRKSYNFGRYLNLTFTDLENIANLLFKNCISNKKQYNKRSSLCSKLICTGVPELARQLLTVNFNI
jgi:hypothetical protein